MSAAAWVEVIFWSSGAIALVLGVVISAEEYITEKLYSSDSKGAKDGKR